MKMIRVQLQSILRALMIRAYFAARAILRRVDWLLRPLAKRLYALLKPVINFVQPVVVALWYITLKSYKAFRIWAEPVLEGVLQPERDMNEESREVLDFIRKPVRFGMKIAIAGGLFFFVWAGIAPLDSASIAPGSVVMDSNRKTIQHLEGGVIKAILVKDGDRVKKGQELVQLNPTTAKARQDTIEGKLLSDRMAEVRLLAEKSGAETFDPAQALKASGIIIDSSDAETKKILDAQSNLFETRQKDYLSQIEILDQRIAQNQDKITGVTAQKEAAEHQLALIEEELAAFNTLLDKGLTTRSRLLDLQREKSMLGGNIGAYISDIASAQEKTSETETQKLNVEALRQKEVATELKEVQDEIAEMSEQLTASSDIYQRTVIAAPLAGVVTGLQYHTIGGVITPGTPIMDIVPDNDTMVIETRIPTQDIDVVHVGLPAKVRLSAYRNRFMPRLEGTLIHLSADKFVDERTQNSYYMGRVKIDEAELKKHSDDLSLYPGMPAEVFIVTGSHTLLEYLFDPVMGSFQRGMSED